MSQITGLLSIQGLSSFRNLGVSDVTPDAVNWPDAITFSTTTTTSMLQITGITDSITLEISWTGSATNTFAYSINSTAVYSQTAILTTSPTNITISNGQYLGFRLSGSIAATRTVTVKNVSDNNTVLDTFYIQNDGGLGGG